MLKINPDPEFTVNGVEITVPGQEKVGTLPVTFFYKTRSDLMEFLGRLKGMSDSEAVAEIVKSWEWPGFEYNEENLDKFLDNYPAAGFDIVTAYRRYSIESRVKN